MSIRTNYQKEHNLNKSLKIFFPIFTCLICSIILIPAHAEGSEKDGQLFTEALQLLKEKKFQSSLIKIRQFLSTNPDNFEAKTNECAVLLELKQLSEAELCLQETLTRKPNDITNLINLGMLYTLQENYESAKTQLSLVHNLVPNDEIAYANLLGVRLLLGEDVDQIINEHKDILSKNEFNVQVLANLGKILNDKKQFDKAKYFLDRAYEIDSKHVNVLEELGVWYALQGDLQNAEKFFLLSLKESPNNISVLNNLGLLHKERGDKSNFVSEYYQSAGYYQSVLHIDPDNVIANTGLDEATKKIQEFYQAFYFRIYLFAIFTFVSGIIVALIYIRDTKKLKKSLETAIEIDNEQVKKILKKILKTKVSIIFLIGSLSIAALIIVLNLSLKIPLNNGSDMTNWTSTVIEIGIGIIIAAVILVYELSKQDQFGEEQKEITKLVKSIQKIERNQEDNLHKISDIVKKQNESQGQQRKFILEHEQRILRQILGLISYIKSSFQTRELFKKSWGSKNVEKWKEAEAEFLSSVSSQLDSYQKDLTSSMQFLDSKIYEDIKKLIWYSKHLCELFVKNALDEDLQIYEKMISLSCQLLELELQNRGIE